MSEKMTATTGGSDKHGQCCRDVCQGTDVARKPRENADLRRMRLARGSETPLGPLVDQVCHQTAVPSTGKDRDRPSEAKTRPQKVSRGALSAIMKSILVCIGSCMERGSLVESLYGLERRYRGWYTDPCFGEKEKQAYEQTYARIQPVVTRSLNRMEKRGLVTLMRHGRYVKWIALTDKGKVLAGELCEDNMRE